MRVHELAWFLSPLTELSSMAWHIRRLHLLDYSIFPIRGRATKLSEAAMGLFTPSFANIAVVFSLFCLYVVGLYIYRAFFDPLSHIPGPKLAAATLWYEFYYDVIKKGRYTWEIGRMHQKYGESFQIINIQASIHTDKPQASEKLLGIS